MIHGAVGRWPCVDHGHLSTSLSLLKNPQNFFIGSKLQETWLQGLAPSKSPLIEDSTFKKLKLGVPWLQLAPYWRTTPASKLRKPASPFAQSRCYPFSSRETDSKCTDKLINYSSCSSLFPKKRNLRLSCTVLYLCVYLYLFAWWPQVPTTAVIADFSSFYTSETPF